MKEPIFPKPPESFSENPFKAEIANLAKGLYHEAVEVVPPEKRDPHEIREAVRRIADFIQSLDLNAKTSSGIDPVQNLMDTIQDHAMQDGRGFQFAFEQVTKRLMSLVIRELADRANPSYPEGT